VLGNGSVGLPVRRLQSRMSAVNYDTGGVDGRFGPKTEAAVKQLQQAYGISVMAWLAMKRDRSWMHWRTLDQ
jgi:peptidoglycan hydrolase-like protein with peptidoglycan-binding domain